MELLDAMRTQHACRDYLPDPVRQPVFHRAVEAARFGPQGGNRQPVRFLIVTDPAKRRQLAEWYLVPWKAYIGRRSRPARQSRPRAATRRPRSDGERSGQGAAAADDFAEHFADHPAIVVALADLADTHPTDTDLGRPQHRRRGVGLPVAEPLPGAARPGCGDDADHVAVRLRTPGEGAARDPRRAVDGRVHRRRLPGAAVPDQLHRRPVQEIAFLDDFDRPLTNDAPVP